MYRNLYADELSLRAQLGELNKQAYKPSGRQPRDEQDKDARGRLALPAPLALARRLASLLAGFLP